MFVIDTNILLYAVNPDSPDHEAARDLLEEWRAGEQPWFLTWGIGYEFLRVSTHARVFPKPLELREAQEWLRILLESPGAGVLVESELHGQILSDLVRQHPRLKG